MVTILKSTGNSETPEDAIRFEEIVGNFRLGKFHRVFWRFPEVKLHAYDLRYLATPLKHALLLRILSRGKCYFVDDTGRELEIRWSTISKMLGRYLRDLIARPEVLRSVWKDIARENKAERPPVGTIDFARRPLYLRTDLWYGVFSGGSVGHVAGVVNNLAQFGGEPLLFTTDRIPTVDSNVETVVLTPCDRHWDAFPELPALISTHEFQCQVFEALGETSPSFIYQRYSLNNYTGLKLARKFGVPLVLEYNGPEVWVSKNWGKAVKTEKLSSEIEILNARLADLVVVVSQPLKDQLVAQGVDANRVLVNPNGVDPEVYSPDVDGSAVRCRYGFDDHIVLGFIGTFGKWHGAEVLADAFGRLLKEMPQLRDRVRLMMLGDGVMMPQVKTRLNQWSVEDLAILTGLIPQHQGPAHLAACDILVSPHVPNSDGTPFFGSPTKLFEYMAMGKGIVASDLDQIGQILSHRESALLVKPGCIESLVDGLAELVESADLRKSLGNEARRLVQARYSWRKHTERIVDALADRCTTAKSLGEVA